VTGIALGCALLLVLQPIDVLVRHLKDDSFYYFKTANNIALGLGSTFDGINQTNGYHPLWMLNVIPVYRLLPDQPLAALRAIMLMAALYHAVASCAIYRLLARLHGRPVGVLLAAAYAASPLVLRMTLNGMESALYAMALAGFAALATLRAKGDDGRWRLEALSPRGALLLGGLLAACALTRLDAALLWLGVVVCAGASLVRRGGLVRHRAALLALVLPAALCLGVYFAFNLAVFGHAMPVSGAIKRPNLALPPAQLAAQLLWPLGPITRRLGLTTTLGCTIVAALGLLALGLRLRALRAVGLAALRRYDWLWVGVALIYAYISLSNSYIANWYYVPMFLLATLAAGEAAGAIARRLRPGRPARAALTAAAGTLAVSYALLATAEFSPHKNDTIYETLRAAEWVRENLPPGEVGAAWNAGVLAYFSGRQVVNLDGLINSYAYYAAMRQGRDAEFVRAQGVSLVFDIFPVPPSGDTAGVAPSAAWAPYLRPRYERRFYAHNVGLSSLFQTVFPQAERDSPFVFKAWDVVRAPGGE
jgi:hypothetical protein